MASEVHASISGLEQLDHSLSLTIPMLDRLVLEAEANANRVLQRIELTLDDYTARKSIAFNKYQQAVSALEYAQRVYDTVPYYYYTAVNSAEREYDRLVDCVHRIEGIKDRFRQQYDTLHREVIEDSETYLTLISKSSAFVHKYSEVLARSISALEGTSLGSNTGGSSSSTSAGGSVQSLQSITAWLKSINPNFDNPFTDKYRINCGSCAFAVDSRLSGQNSNAVASATNISTDAAMERATGKKCVYMPVQDIEDYLVSQGAGSHLIVGIDRFPGPDGKSQAGHWFNAYYDGKNAYTIDGQNGAVYDWPHDYGSVSRWCALI